jgi:hypothetical protein
MGAIGVSLIFVGLQLRQSEEAAMADLSQSTVAVGIEISALMAENSSIWLRACAGEELSQSEQLIANSIYFRYIQDNFNSWNRSGNTSTAVMPPTFFTDAAAANMYRYPGFMQMALSYGDWAKLGLRNEDYPVTQRYIEEIRSRITQLQTEEPKPNTDLTWCGIR